MGPGYGRYDSDRRSRSPRGRSQDRFESDRRRSLAEGRGNNPFQSNRDSFAANRDNFGDPIRREPPKGPRAHFDPPSGPRGGLSEGFRGGRGRGRGRGWSSRDDDRDRGRDRDLDFRDRDRFLEDRSRERDRDRDRDRDWDRRDSYRSRRSPPGRGGRSPTRDFRDRDRDGPPGPDADRPRRNSRDGPPIGSPLSEPQFGAPRGRGGFRGRGRGRGGWDHERDRGRPPFDDRGDRYPRSRSQEGRWGPPNRERDERDRNDRFPENEPRRDPRADRDRADLFEKKLGARSATSQEPPSNNRDVSPPPVAPSAPAFGSVPNRGDSQAGKLPPTGPRAFTERHGQEPSGALPGPPKGGMPDSPPIPVGPRAQQQKAQRPSSKQWINPNLKRAPDSPKMMRAQTINQTRPGPPRRESSQMDQPYDSRRPQSSDSKSGHDPMDIDKRRESTHSAEPGEIMSKSDEDVPVKSEPDERRPRASDDPNSLRDVDETDKSARSMKGRIKLPKPHISKTVRFSKPLATQTQPVVEPDSESDDDEDMLDYFNMEIEKTEAELSKLQLPGRPREVVARFASMSHGAMVKILNETDGLEKMVGKMPEGLKIPRAERKAQSPNRLDASLDGTRAPEKSAETKEESTERDEAMAESRLANLELKPEAMQVDETSKTTAPPATAKSESADVTMTEGKAAPTFTSTEKRSGELPAAENILPTVIADQRPLPTTETGSKPPSTPSHVEDEGDDEETESEEEEIEIVDTQVVRKLMSTPPLDDLPHFEVPPWDQEPDFKSMDSDSLLDGYILDHLNKVRLDRTAEQKALQQIYVKKYRGYLDFTQSEDPIAIRSRDKYSVSGPPPPVEVPGPTTPEPTSGREGRGGRRFASERDLERVLQASMREEDERREREMRMQKEKTRSDKEATIPDMYWDAEEKQEQQFQDRSGFVPPERLVSAWEVLPPVNNFTAEENDAFEKTYLQLPKQWGKVAEAIPNRDFGACIQYYYLMKRELNLKDKLKRQPKRRKKGGRGKQRSSALVSELGNGDAEGDENNDTGENGENRRRPRRAAAPTWGFEQPPTESESATPVGTPGRRGAGASKGDQPEKVDGRKTRKRKDKDAKVPKPNQMLAAAPGPGRGRARSEVKGQNIEFQTPLSGDVHRLPTHFEQQPAGMQPPFSVSQPHQQGIQGLDRSQPLGPGSTMADVMAAPSLRPEPPPPPQPAMTTFNLSQPQPERKAPTQASSYWSVSESNDFPGLLRAFGSDWTAIAAHMGSKTAVMVKNYYVRQKEAGRVEWESMIQEADAKRSRGEKRPDPPQPTTTGRGRRYDPSGGGASRPLAAAPGGIELAPESTRPKTEAGPAPGPQGYPAYGVPIAQAPTQPLMGERGQKTIAMQQQPQSQQQHPSVSQAMSPAAPPLRAPPQSFGFEREREREREQSQQRVPLPQQAAGQPHPDVSRPPMHSAPAEPSMELQKREILQQQQQQREREQARARELEAKENQMEREMLRQPDRRAMGLQPEQERPGRQFDAFGRPLYGSRDAPRGDPLSMSRHPQEAPHHGAPQYPPPHSSSQPMRSLLGDHPSAQSPPPLGPPTSRPLSSMQHRQSSGSVTEIRGTSTSQSSTPAPPAAAPRPPEPRKSNIMSLLNDDPPPPPKRVNDVSTQPSSTSATPPPQGLGRPPPGYQPPSHMRRESEQQYPPYGGRPTSAAPTGMPSLKPTYSSPSQPSRSAYAPVDSPGERDFYGRPQYQPGHQSQTNSPQATHQYPTHSSRGPGQPQGGYPSAYGAGQPPSASSPPPQFSLHAPSRPGDPPRGSRESWPPSHQQGPSPGSWGREPPKGSQPPPPQHPWPAPHGSGTPKAGTPTGQWPAAAPPPSQAHPGMRDERGPPMYGSQQQPPPQHQMQSRYAQPPPSSRGPESVPPPAQAYPRYATPGPGAPRDPRDMPPRSYTPASYDGRGPHPAPPGPGYPGADPRNMQLRESRDPRDQQMSEREMIARGLRPPEYGRPGEPYGGR